MTDEPDRPMITLILAGPFSRTDVIAILKLVRFIDSEDPSGAYFCQIQDPSETIADAEGVIREAWPEQPDRKQEIRIIRKQ